MTRESGHEQTVLFVSQTVADVPQSTCWNTLSLLYPCKTRLSQLLRGHLGLPMRLAANGHESPQPALQARHRNVALGNLKGMDTWPIPNCDLPLL